LSVGVQPSFDEGCELMVAQCRAEHARAHARNSPDNWGAVVQALEQRERPWSTAYAKWRHAEALLMTDDRADSRSLAAQHLCDAHVVAVQLRAKPLQADIEDIATRARIDLGAAPTVVEATEPDPVPFGLTPRELEVLRLVAQGYSNGRIGKELFISTKTASVHVSNILRKLNATNRIEAAAIANKAGIGRPVGVSAETFSAL
jgi:DNA-binding CsgD family transcriptional regulator